MVSWLGKTCVLAPCIHRHAPWDITNRDLVALWNIRQKLMSKFKHVYWNNKSISPYTSSYMFLNTQLLELDKLGASGLQVESASGFVSDALLAGTHDEGHEGGRLDLKDKTLSL